ncbi:MAG TPA: hypothetical protein VEO54_12815 [Thermoanaerobaculia bacterium]|nr:hypothetical protein [Thermoanaerobaculia bacterium]
MNHRAQRRLQTTYDPLLRPLAEARDAAARHEALEQILVRHATPVIRKVLARYRDTGGALHAEDADDVAATVLLRLLRRLDALETSDEPIERLEDYVATQTYNAIHDVLRRRHPQRTRLKNQLRYVLTRDTRLALWNSPAGLVAGLARHRGAAPATEVVLPPERHDRERIADAVQAILESTGDPVLLDALIQALMDLWSVGDERTFDTAPGTTDVAAGVESRDELAALWREILELRPPQRAALLLNLRDPDGGSVIALFILLGIATIDELAQAIGMTAEELAELWNELPIGDLDIAGRLGVTRQQVINLRKSARERLARRMARRR